MRHQGFSLWKLSASLCGMGLVALFIYPVFKRAKENEHPRSCQSNLKIIAMGMRQYIEDYDYAFPAVSRGSEGWVDALQPYLKMRQIFHCPGTGSDEAENSSDYFFNARLSAIAAPKNGKQKIEWIGDLFPNPSFIIMNGDGVPQAGTNSAQSSLNATDQLDSPARRHMYGANYSFIDGHVKWYRPDQIGNEPSIRVKDRPTFAIK